MGAKHITNRELFQLELFSVIAFPTEIRFDLIRFGNYLVVVALSIEYWLPPPITLVKHSAQHTVRKYEYTPDARQET